MKEKETEWKTANEYETIPPMPKDENSGASKTVPNGIPSYKDREYEEEDSDDEDELTSADLASSNYDSWADMSNNMGRRSNRTSDSHESSGISGNGTRHGDETTDSTSMMIDSYPKPWRAKIAVIDCGVVVVGNKKPKSLSIQELHHNDNTNHKVDSNMASRIKEGESFVYSDGIEQPWWHASAAHGSQMASLICAIDPCCELYIAKVGETTTSGVSAERVIEVSLRDSVTISLPVLLS